MSTADVSDQFWPTAATVVPVLALALIVEVRTTITQWDSDFPWLLRSIQGLSWANVLIQFGLVEIVAFNDLSGDKTSKAWVSFAKLAIFVSLITLVLTPALSILGKTNMGAFVRLLTRFRTAPLEWRHHRLVRRTKKLRCQLTKKKAIFEQRIALATSTESKSDLASGLEDIEKDLKEITDIQTEMREQWSEYIQSRARLIRELDAELNRAEQSIKKESESK